MLDVFGEENWETAEELADEMLAWFRVGDIPQITSVGDCFMVIFQDVQARRSTADSIARAIAAPKLKLR